MPDGTQTATIQQPGAEIRSWLFDRLPKDVTAGLTQAQRAALAEAVRNPPRAAHVANLRFSIPLLIGRYYLTVLAGRERRNAERRAQDRAEHPLRTAGNLLTIIIGALMLYGTAVFGVLLYASAIGF